MKEDFLHYVWRTKNFAQHNLRTTDGREIQILDFGQLNRQGGPDFKNCRVMVDDMTWAGSVEMHLVSSYWEDHGHSSDPAYENVILHVVLEEDRPVFINGSRLPCIEMKERIPGELLSRYHKLMQKQEIVPCAAHLPDICEMVRDTWLQRMSVERLESRTKYFQLLADRYQNDWNEILYVALAKGFGFKSNGEAMERMARAVPLRVIRSLSDRKQVEAVLFGAAGMLNRIFCDDYAVGLQRGFDHICRKHEIKPIDARCWQWGRLRPANLPSVRIAQFADLMFRHPDIAGTIRDYDDVNSLRTALRCQVSHYWQDHTDFDRFAKFREKRLGQGSVDRILINTVIPFLFIYGKYRSLPGIGRRAADLLMEIPSENNRITRLWEHTGMPNRHAGDSQALLHLKRSYCDAFRCTNCAIGHDILNKPAGRHAG